MATEVLGWSPAPQSSPWGLDERVRPEPLPGPEFSSFHCFTWTTNPTPTRPSSMAQKRRRLPPYILGLGFGERGCSKPSKPGIRTPGTPAPANGAQLSVSPLVQARFSCLQDKVLAYLFISQNLSSFSSHSSTQHIY